MLTVAAYSGSGLKSRSSPTMEREMRTPGRNAIPGLSFGQRRRLAADVYRRDHGRGAQRHVGRAAVKDHGLTRPRAGPFGKKISVCASRKALAAASIMLAVWSLGMNSTSVTAQRVSGLRHRPCLTTQPAVGMNASRNTTSIERGMIGDDHLAGPAEPFATVELVGQPSAPAHDADKEAQCRAHDCASTPPLDVAREAGMSFTIGNNRRRPPMRRRRTGKS